MIILRISALTIDCWCPPPPISCAREIGWCSKAIKTERISLVVAAHEFGLHFDQLDSSKLDLARVHIQPYSLL